MQIPGKIVVAILLSNGILMGFAQKKKNAVIDVPSLFADLPIADASANSVPGENERVADKIRKNIFLKGGLNKSTAYPGEEVLVTYRLFTALSSRSRIASKPSLIHFKSLELEIHNDTMQQQLINNKNYRVFTIWQARLSPFQVGHLAIDPMLVDNTVDYTTKDKKQGRYSGLVKSNVLDMTILPLPEINKPAGFSGIVGKFEIHARVSKAKNETGENNNLHIEIAGSGNFDNISVPAIRWPDGIDHFLITEALLTEENSFPQQGKKTFDIPFAVNQAGNYVLPSLTLSYFDPSLKIYQTVASDPVVMAVSASAANEKGKPVPPVSTKVSGQSRKFLWISFGMLAAGIAFISIFLFRRRVVRKSKKEEAARLAAKEQEKRPFDFVAAMQRIGGLEDDKEYIREVKFLITKLIQEKFSTNLSSDGDLLRLIAGQSKDEEFVRDAQEIFDHCSRFLYAPSAGIGFRDAMTKMMNRMVNKINLI